MEAGVIFMWSSLCSICYVACVFGDKWKPPVKEQLEEDEVMDRGDDKGL